MRRGSSRRSGIGILPDAKQNPFFPIKDWLTTGTWSMNQTVKLVLYVALTLALAILSFKLYSALQSPATPATPGTSAPAAAGSPPLTPAGEPDTNQAAPAAAGNANLAATTNLTATTVAQPPAPANSGGDDSELTSRRSSRNLGRATGYGVAMFFVFIALALLIARDVSRYLGGRVEDFIFNDNLEGIKDPEYEEAERIHAKGDHLESVRLMRAYLNKHPREQYVALRIAEIYETDLRNYLAAALEYEDVLKKKLPPERWGWAAIHLANLYSGKLDKISEATRLLRRIVDEYGQTTAAKKARERLGIPAPVEVSDAPAPGAAPAEAVEEPEPEPVPPPPPAHNLPKGFRPK